MNFSTIDIFYALFNIFLSIIMLLAGFQIWKPQKPINKEWLIVLKFTGVIVFIVAVFSLLSLIF